MIGGLVFNNGYSITPSEDLGDKVSTKEPRYPEDEALICLNCEYPRCRGNCDKIQEFKRKKRGNKSG